MQSEREGDMANDYELLTSDPEFLRKLRQEELILEVTEVLTRALDDAEVRKTELAERMGKSKGFISQLFGGGRNLTLRTISDVALALGLRPRVKLCSEVEWGRYVQSIPLTEWKQCKVLNFPYSAGPVVPIESQEPVGDCKIAQLA